MKESKQILVACIAITIFSLVGIIIFHTGTDIQIIEYITNKDWECVEHECEFFQSILSNIFTGALVSVFMTYVSYFRAKHDFEFVIISNSKMILICFDTLSSGMYRIDLQNTQVNDWCIFMYKEDIERIASCSDKITDSLNAYCPFFNTKKTKKLRLISEYLNRITSELDCARKYIMFQSDLKPLKNSMEDTAKIINEHKEAVDRMSKILEAW